MAVRKTPPGALRWERNSEASPEWSNAPGASHSADIRDFVPHNLV